MRVREGFALLTVLWVMVAASVVALSAAVTTRANVDASRNRVDSERALWRSHDCLERARAAIDESLAAASREGKTLQVWRRMDGEVASIRFVATDGCDVRMEAAGSRLDVNAADVRELRTLFRALDVSDPDGLADRLLDWRDSDDDPRVAGAERGWYLARGRIPPRNGPLADARELRRIAGFEALSSLQAVLGVEAARICINTAPLSVLQVVPGFTPEIISRIAFERENGRDITDVIALSAVVSRTSADSVMAHYPEMTRMTTVNPDAWIVVARGWAGTPELNVFTEARIILGPAGAVVTRRRSWE